MTRKQRPETKTQANGKPVAADFVATIVVTNHIIVHATTPEAARKQIERLIPGRYGVSRQVEITSIERC